MINCHEDQDDNMTKIARVRIMTTLISGLGNKVDDTMRFTQMLVDQDDIEDHNKDDKGEDEDEDLGVWAELVDKVVSVSRHIVF